MLVIFLFTLPLIVNSRIAINVTVQSTYNSDLFVKVNYTGGDYKLVTDKELKLFNVTNERLNTGMRVELGKVPNDIYIRDPTPYGDLFYKFHWEQLKRRLTVSKWRLIDIIHEDVVLDTHEHINNTPNNIKSKKSMYKLVENTASSTWSKGLPEDNIISNITIQFGYGQIKYESKWRNESIRTAKTTFGVSKPGSITIKPEQTVVTKLTATKTIVLIGIVYEAKLVGSVIANYAELYGKYHFWAPSVVSIMKAANMKNGILTEEVLEVRCFTNPRLEIYDKLSGEILDPLKKRPLIKILRNNNVTRILYVKRKPKSPKQKKNKLK